VGVIAWLLLLNIALVLPCQLCFQLLLLPFCCLFSSDLSWRFNLGDNGVSFLLLDQGGRDIFSVISAFASIELGLGFLLLEGRRIRVKSHPTKTTTDRLIRIARPVVLTLQRRRRPEGIDWEVERTTSLALVHRRLELDNRGPCVGFGIVLSFVIFHSLRRFLGFLPARNLLRFFGIFSLIWLRIKSSQLLIVFESPSFPP